MIVAAVALAAAGLFMLVELALSRTNERALRARGAVEPAHDVYRAMSWTYPLCFVAAGIEGAVRNPAFSIITIAGAACFAAAKALKYWAIASLGPRWSFRVLVPPGDALVTRGPYTWMRHPNYVAVLGELAGFALLVGAPIAGVVGVSGFSVLLRRRIAVEERALGLGAGD